MNADLDRRRLPRSISKMVALAGIGIAGVLLASCGSEAATFPDGAFAVIASRDVAVGPSRLLIAVSDETGGRLGSPADHIEIEAAPLDQAGQPQRVPAEFTWMINGAVGVYQADLDFDRAGDWAITVHPTTGQALPWSPITVMEETLAPNIGEAAPAVPTPTLRDHPLDELTTDQDPDPRFYQTSLDDALRTGKKTVLVFSTPAFCQTAACGPVLDNAKTVSRSYPDVQFIHVEVYTGFTEPGFVPDSAHLAPAVRPGAWNLPTEPWVFVISEAGEVTARFEGVMSAEDLTAALN